MYLPAIPAFWLAFLFLVWMTRQCLSTWGQPGQDELVVIAQGATFVGSIFFFLWVSVNITF